MKSGGIPSLKNGFASGVGRVSDHLVVEDAQAEIELFDCELPFQGSE